MESSPLPPTKRRCLENLGKDSVPGSVAYSGQVNICGSGHLFQGNHNVGSIRKKFTPHPHLHIVTSLDNTISSANSVDFATLEQEVTNYGKLLELGSASISRTKHKHVAGLHLSSAASDHSLVKIKLQQLHEQKIKFEQNELWSQERNKFESGVQDLRATVKSNIKLLDSILM